MLEDNIVRAQGHMAQIEAVFTRGETARFSLEYDSAELEPLSLDKHVRVVLEVTIAPVRDAQGRVTNAVIIHRDVTAERRAERRLRDAKEYAELLVDSANALILVVHRDETLAVFNRAAESLTGFTRDELGRAWMTRLVPPDRQAEGRELFTHGVSSEGSAELDLPILSRAGEEHLVRWQATPLLAGGEPVGTIAYGVDITERRKLEEQLRHSQRLEAVGQLAGGVAHDFNNMLSVILGYCELLRDSLPADHAMQEDLAEIERAGSHSRNITRQLLAFSRRQIIAPRTVELNPLVSGLLENLARLIGEDVVVHFHPGDALWTVRVDPTQVEQILVNLAVNARDAMTTGGALTIETGNASFDDVYCATHLECRPGEYVLLAVSDEGAGMDAVTLEHVFEPFFTTKAVGEGTGLGLAMVYGIVKQNGGFINVYSELGSGTVFKIYLPRFLGPSDIVEDASAASDARRSGVVLLVEDEIMVRRMTAQMLKRLGYEVVAVDGTEQALAYCERPDVVIDLLLTDVVMPHMSGPQLHARISALKPGTRALYMSGYTENVIVRHGVLKDAVVFLQKPFSARELDEKVGEALKS
ncbi:MAG: PAS domain S-box protein [Myxococcales bacterium]|nr:PAS domain S-box protein [Myxococcales bacterium]